MKIRTASILHKFENGNIITGSESFGRAEVITAFTDPDETDVMGHNALVTGKVRNANGLVRTVEVVDSGFGYVDGKSVDMTPETANNQFVLKGNITVDQTGKGEGYWQTNSSELNSEMRIRDNDYYQEYSYEIVAKMSLDKYRQSILDLAHVSGTKMFAKFGGVSDITHETTGYFDKTTEQSILNRYNANSSFIIMDFGTGEVYNKGESSTTQTLTNS